VNSGASRRLCGHFADRPVELTGGYPLWIPLLARIAASDTIAETTLSQRRFGIPLSLFRLSGMSDFPALLICALISATVPTS
jgi:hypothetical protein